MHTRMPAYILFLSLIFSNELQAQDQTRLERKKEFHQNATISYNQRNWELSIAFCDSALKYIPEDQGTKELRSNAISSWIKQAKEYYNQSDYRGALTQFENILKYDSTNLDLINWSAELTKQLGFKNKEFYYLSQWVNLAPLNPDVHSRLGNYFEGQKEWQKATTAYEAALKLKPKDKLARENLARCTKNVLNIQTWVQQLDSLIKISDWQQIKIISDFILLLSQNNTEIEKIREQAEYHLLIEKIEKALKDKVPYRAEELLADLKKNGNVTSEDITNYTQRITESKIKWVGYPVLSFVDIPDTTDSNKIDIRIKYRGQYPLQDIDIKLNEKYQTDFTQQPSNDKHTIEIRVNLSLDSLYNALEIKVWDTQGHKQTFKDIIMYKGTLPPKPKIVPLIKGNYYALIIAVQDYIDTNITKLDFPLHDAKNLANVLMTNYTFEERNVKLLENPDREAIFTSLQRLRKELNEDDNLLIFYAGHGDWDAEVRQGYWLPRDAAIDNPSNWTSNSDLRDLIRGIKTKHTLLISDACFSGGLFKTRNVTRPKNDGDTAIRETYKMTSRRAITSGFLKSVPDKSVFLEYLLRELMNNKSTYLYAQKLYINIKDPVIRESPNHQTPLYGVIEDTGDEEGDFIFVRK